MSLYGLTRLNSVFECGAQGSKRWPWVTAWFLIICLLFSSAQAHDKTAEQPWLEVQATARGQTVYWHAWAGSQAVNDYIGWVAEVMAERFDITLRHVKLADSAVVVSQMLADKAAGRLDQGRVDLVWINGENFAALKQQRLLFGPFADRLPHARYLDIEHKPSLLVDFTVPTEGYESPWGHSQIVFYYDMAQVETPPRTSEQLQAWAVANPGRFSYPAPPDFTGTTFLKQLLYEHVEDPTVLMQAPTDQVFEAATAGLWSYLERLHPHLWRSGRSFPANHPQLRQLVDDGELDIGFSFNVAEADAAITQGLLPPTVRAYVWDGGTIANTHFVAIPFNATAKEGAMIVADFLLSPQAQARKQDSRVWGDRTVLNLNKLNAAERALFSVLPQPVAGLGEAELERRLAEPHPDWALRLEREWLVRYGR